jgi:hypothetical protein
MGKPFRCSAGEGTAGGAPATANGGGGRMAMARAILGAGERRLAGGRALPGPRAAAGRGDLGGNALKRWGRRARTWLAMAARGSSACG